MSRHIILVDELISAAALLRNSYQPRQQFAFHLEVPPAARESFVKKWEPHGIDPEKDPEGAAKRIEAAARKRRCRKLKRMGISHAMAKAFTS